MMAHGFSMVFRKGHVRYRLSSVPHQPNSPYDIVFLRNDFIQRNMIELKKFHFSSASSN